MCVCILLFLFVKILQSMSRSIGKPRAHTSAHTRKKKIKSDAKVGSRHYYHIPTTSSSFFHSNSIYQINETCRCSNSPRALFDLLLFALNVKRTRLIFVQRERERPNNFTCLLHVLI